MSLGLNKLGPYWEPGRKGPESLYDLLPFPQEGPWDEKTFQRVKFDQTSSEAYKQQKEDAPPPPATRHFPVAMSKRMTRDGLMRSLKTWSSVHNYMEKHPSGENVIDSFYNEVVELLPTEEPFDVQWPVGMLLMQKQK